MRRFEFSEGTSHKFWQVETDGATLRVAFGRIGTSGQTQEKTFASATAADAEMAKLIKEKTKKGYAEVGAVAGAPAPKPAAPKPVAPGPAATPAPAAAQPAAHAVAQPAAHAAAQPAAPPEPAPAPAPRAEAGTIAWTDSALRGVAPMRGSALVPLRKPDGKASFERIAKAFAAHENRFLAGKRQADADPERMMAAWDAFAGAPQDTLDLDAQAAAFALVGPRLAYSDHARADDFVRYWRVKAGAAFALDAAARASRLLTVNDDKQLAILRAPREGRTAWWVQDFETGWSGLREMVCAASDSERLELHERARRAAREGGPALRALFAAAFEDLEMCPQADRDELLKARALPGFWPLILSAPDLATARALLAGAPRDYLYGQRLAEMSHALLARYGADAAGILIEWLKAGVGAADRLRELADAVALAVTGEVAAFFVSELANHQLRTAATPYLIAHPEVSLAPVEKAAAGRGPVADAAKIILKSLKAGDAPRDAAEVAAHEDLPRVLAAPPWLEKRTLPPPVVVELAPLPSEERIVWLPGEQDRVANTRMYYGSDAQSALARLRALPDAPPSPALRSWEMLSAAALTVLPRAEYLALVPRLDPAWLCWSYSNAQPVLLARVELDAVDLIVRTFSFDPLNALDALRRVVSARVAPLMADAFVRLKKARATAGDWLATHPEVAAIGLIPQALARPGKPRTAAEAALRLIAQRGGRATLEAVAKRYGPEGEKGVAALLDYDPLLAFPAKLPKLPDFVKAGALSAPRLASNGKALPVTAVEHLLTMLAFTSLETPYAGIAGVREACDRRSLGELAFELFQSWLNAGAPSKESWAFTAMGLLGDDECARRITPLIRAWPGEAAHARAVTGLDVLAMIGTDVALMHLHGIAQKLKFKGLQEKAREKIDHIAEARGLSADELADRLVPDLGLDDDGSLALDFGPRRFRVVFDESLKPAVTDDAGKRLPDLPKPKQTDDAEKSKAAVETWKALKKDAKTIAAGQVARLEVAMCSERRWDVAVFRRFFLEHPLLVHLVKRLLWGVYGADGRLASGFRVAEDGTLANDQDAPYMLAGDAVVGLVHRLALDDGAAARWGQIFGDYEILQPFAQLGREVITLTPAERQASASERVKGLVVPTGKLFGLDPRGWRRGTPQDAGIVAWYEKPLPGGLTACLDLDPGIFTGMVQEAPQQTLGALTLVEGDGYSWNHETRVPFERLSRIGQSELMRDLESLRG